VQGRRRAEKIWPPYRAAGKKRKKRPFSLSSEASHRRKGKLKSKDPWIGYAKENLFVKTVSIVIGDTWGEEEGRRAGLRRKREGEVSRSTRDKSAPSGGKSFPIIMKKIGRGEQPSLAVKKLAAGRVEALVQEF